MREALALFQRARELDPGFATATAHEAIARVGLVAFLWDDDPEGVAESLKVAEAALALAEDDPWAHVALGFACGLGGQRSRGIAAFERAIELNPSLTLAYQGLSGALAAEHPDEAVRVIEKAIRLSPRDPQMHLMLNARAVGHLMAGRFAEAVASEEESLRLRADQPHVYRVLAAAYGHLGRNADALAALAKMQQVAPHFTLDTFRRANSAALVERCLEGWRRAGWHE